MYRIALVSNNGESIDRHFGQARNFLIYEIRDDEVAFIEDRQAPPLQSKTAHDEEYLSAVVHLLADCAALFVLRMGSGAAQYLLQHRIRVFEVNFPLHRILTTLLKNQQRGKVRIFER